jgi:hypothetical protein
MKSPFPGMDPYLEQHWRDVHASLLTYIRDALQEILPRDLLARIEEQVTIDPDRPPRKGAYFHPDVSISEPWIQAPVVQETDLAVAVPLIFPAEEELERHLEILGADGSTPVTVIEVLSPTNRRAGPSRDSYIAKRRAYQAAGVNVVELDFLRAGEHTIAVRLNDIPPRQRGTYYASVWRAAEAHWELYPLPLREMLPRICIPLRTSDDDVILALQPLLDQAYTRGRYDRIDYAKPLDPPLENGDAEWLREQLRARAGTPHA